jgi:hypothetical protein
MRKGLEYGEEILTLEQAVPRRRMMTIGLAIVLGSATAGGGFLVGRETADGRVKSTSKIPGSDKKAPGDNIEKHPPFLAVDIAILGSTFRPNLLEGAFPPAAGNVPDLRGGTFVVEGRMYPSGSIPESEGAFDPESIDSIGVWFCRGEFLAYPGRPAPALLTQQQFLMGAISPQTAPPEDTLTTSGIETTSNAALRLVRRTILGGTGKYNSASGTCYQRRLGSNNTKLETLKAPADNLRMAFYT